MFLFIYIIHDYSSIYDLGLLVNDCTSSRPSIVLPITCCLYDSGVNDQSGRVTTRYQTHTRSIHKEDMRPSC